MRSCRTYQRLAAALLGATCASWGAAQQAHYLVPQRFQARPGDRLRLHVEAGDALHPRRSGWPAEAIDWFYVRVAGTQQNRQQEQARPARATEDFITLTLARPGVTLIGYDTRPTLERVRLKALRALLAGRVAPAALPAGAPDAQLRVRRIRSTKTLVRVSDARRRRVHSAVAQSKSGQQAEIRPLFDPTMLTVGSDLPLRVYLDGSKRAGVRVRAASAAGGTVQTMTSDQSGATHFRITHAGVWRIAFSHAEPTPRAAPGAAAPEADWTIYTATLTFEVPQQEGAAK